MTTTTMTSGVLGSAPVDESPANAQGEGAAAGRIVTPRIVGIDLSLTSTGIATNTETARIRTTGHNGDSLITKAHRLQSIRNVALGYCKGADLVVVEGPSFNSQTGSQHERSGLWWAIVMRLVANDIPVAVVPPANLKKYATGKGGGPAAGKDAVLAAAVKRFPGREITGNDIADAVWLHAMGCDWLGHPVVLMPDAHRKSLAACEWPELVSA